MSEPHKAGAWNAFGLVDMVGNVWEWLEDFLGAGGDAEMPYDLISPSELSYRPQDIGESDMFTGFRAALNIPGL